MFGLANHAVNQIGIDGRLGFVIFVIRLKQNTQTKTGNTVGSGVLMKRFNFSVAFSLLCFSYT